MKKDKKKEDESNFTDSLALETDQQILDQINKRNEESQALKKLLDNLNSPFTKQEAKS